MTTPSTVSTGSRRPAVFATVGRARLAQTAPSWTWAFGIGLIALACAGTSSAQTHANYPITSGQRSTAQSVAQAGVPLSELAPNAPDKYTIKRGDTLWDISGLFLKRPWRWPELWGMNLQQIRNPHLIYPGQVLVLTRVGDRAYLSFQEGSENPTVKLSPRVRAEPLSNAAIPPIPLHVIEPFLSQSQVVDAATLLKAPRIVATRENRVLLSRGDRAYARGQYGKSEALEGNALSTAPGQNRNFQIYRNAVELKDPETGAVLGYEAQFLGQAYLARGEVLREMPGKDGQTSQTIEPATIDITLSQEEIRIGDRLLPAPERELPTYIPHAPATPITGAIVKVHGNAVLNAGQNQVVILNRGSQDGLERGHVLSILQDKAVMADSTDESKPALFLPGERNGLMMVFRTYEHVSYALILHIVDGVQVGHRFTAP